MGVLIILKWKVPGHIQYFLDPFCNFHFFIKSVPLHALFIAKTLQTIQTLSQHFKKQHFQQIETTGRQQFENYVFSFSGGPKTIVFLRAFIKTELYYGGILIGLGNLKLLKHSKFWKSEHFKT